MYSRPNSRFGEDGTLEIRASAASNCRRALWYEANEQPVTNARTEESLTVLEAGNALEPVVLRAMRRAGWEIEATDRDNPADGVPAPRPFAGGNRPRGRHRRRAHLWRRTQRYRDQDQGAGGLQAAGGRWAPSGATRSRWPRPPSTPTGRFQEARDVVIATMDTGSRQWDFEVIPAEQGGGSLPPGLRAAGALSAPTTPCTGRTRRPCRSGTSPPTTGSASAAPSLTPACRGRRCRTQNLRTNLPSR